jgi:hypothetical protein
MKNCPKLFDGNHACCSTSLSVTSLARRTGQWRAAAKQLWSLSDPLRSGRPCHAGSGRPRWRQGWCAADASSCGGLTDTRNPRWRRWSASNAPSSASGRGGFWLSASRGWSTLLAAAPRAFFPPEVAIQLVRLACERPDILGRRLSQWDGHELARQLTAEAIVEDISAATVRRIRAAHQLQPWRQHLWLYPQHPRAAGVYATVAARIELYTRPLRAAALVLSLEEKTALPPRPRASPTLPAQPYHRPNRCAHASTRAGALNLFAACETRSGQVYGPCDDRKRQQECMVVLEHWDRAIAAPSRTIHLVGDHVSTHHGTEVTSWIAHHPRVVVHFTPVPCAWMNHVEPWCSILPRTRVRIADLPTNDQLRATLAPFICAWHQQAHPFNWSVKSVAKVMAEAPALAA